MTRFAALLLVLAACSGGEDITYHWDRDRVLCSVPIDDLSHEVAWDKVDEQLDNAAAHGSVAILHAHKPGITVSLASIERALTSAAERGLPTITFRELDGPPRGALAFAFDDNSPELWLTAQDLLAAHDARITLFVSRWTTMTDAQRADVMTLASLGHDLQPHSVAHVDAVEYVAANGVDAYVADEVLPSFTPLEQLGYPPTTYAYPFGSHTAEIDLAVLAHISRVRAAGECDEP
ncbi:MAG TPA: polysaccharide deacetylase family protein [Kofleriaceae bacterium]|nr:polysaccharide deacetylase family protein [Kofleriaceae bacterium]